MHLRRRSASGYFGVQARPSGRSDAEIRSGDERIRLGTFDTAHEAAGAYDAVAWRLGRSRRTMNFHDVWTREQAEASRRHRRPSRASSSAADGSSSSGFSSPSATNASASMLGDIVSRAISVVVQKCREQTTANEETTIEDNLQRLHQLLLRISAVIEEAEGRCITNQGMIRQVSMMIKQMFRGYYLLDSFKCRNNKTDDEEVSLSSFAQSKFNPAKRFRRLSSNTQIESMDMQSPISMVDGHFSSKAVAAEELSVALSSVSSPSQRLVVQDVASEALAKKVQVTPSTSRGRRNVLGRTRPSPPLGDAALASHPTHGPGGGQLLPAHAGVDGGEQQITAVGEHQLTVAGEQRLKSVSEQKLTYVGEKQLTCTGKQQLTSMCEHALKYVGEKQFTSAPLEHGQRVAGAAPAGCNGEQQPRLAASQTERHGPARGCVGEQQLLLPADQPVSRGPASGVSLPAAVADRMLRLEVVVSREGKGGSSEAVAAVGLEPTVAAVAPSSPATLSTTPRSPMVTTGRVSTPTSPSPVVTPLRQPLHATPSRRSMRQVTTTDGAVASDEDSLSRAMRRKAASNLDSTEVFETWLNTCTLQNALVIIL
ncbi:hypothetical protein QYE76_016141 [Lolium multiflorum]|uniref:AP2/ERF domain-containing protein n=1 Tax=Lolium multiflorum TaxID=4521 RepID=A0AAD8U7V4_LOLMU|nr:hypothetical protein QYE76_016141 [Lolium multiflorum]